MSSSYTTEKVTESIEATRWY